jgi:hypothetical protein
VSGYTTRPAWRPEPFSGVADVRRVLAEFERGATIVLQGLHHNWLPLARYCRQLEAFLGHPCRRNAYYTPAGSQGLPVHHDTHEVISLQVAGEKRWLVYEPVLELPLKNQRYRSALGAAGEPVLDVTLRAGDTMYLPRGWLHQALTSARTHCTSRSASTSRAGSTKRAPQLDVQERRARVPGDDRRRRAARAPRRSTPTPSGARAASASSAHGGRSWTASCPSCARSTSSRRDGARSGATP